MEPCTLLDWDTAFWGFRVATVSAGKRLDDELADRIIRWAHFQKIRCLYFAADGTCPRTIALAHRHGFRFVDTRMQLAQQGQSGCIMPRDLHGLAASVRPAVTTDLPKVRQLAAGCHTDTRFFKDVNFPRDRAAELYARWIDADFARQRLYVAAPEDAGGQAVGYCSYSHTGGDRGRIGLIGVSEDFRGRGLAGELLRKAKSAIEAIGCRYAEVFTQATNTAALRLYCKEGYTHLATSVWFHWWS
jgi:ribosomal protein S18 acetylase RimI-like enzyme